MRPNEQQLADLHEGEIVVYCKPNNALIKLLAKGGRETEHETPRSVQYAGGQRGLHQTNAAQ